MERDLCRHKSSSWCRMVLISDFSALILCMWSALFSVDSSSSSFFLSFYFVLEFPKVVLLQSTKACRHCLIFSKSLNIGLPFRTGSSQASRTTLSQSGWATHFSSNRLGSFLLLLGMSGLAVDIRISTWLEYDTWRWLTLTWGKRAFHLMFAHALSNLSCTKFSPNLPLSQVTILAR